MPSSRMRKAATMRGLLEFSPWLQMRTFVLARLEFINLEELVKTELKFYRECSETKTLKCLILGLIKRFFYLKTETTAPKFSRFNSSYFSTILKLPKARPPYNWWFLSILGSMIQLNSFASKDSLVSCLSRSDFRPGTLSADLILLNWGNFGSKQSIIEFQFKYQLYKISLLIINSRRIIGKILRIPIFASQILYKIIQSNKQHRIKQSPVRVCHSINTENQNQQKSFIFVFTLIIQQLFLEVSQGTNKMIIDELQTLGIALILVKNPITKKYLAVNEKDGSWWLPGGKIDAPQLFSVGAIRQTKQEGGIDVSLKGILRFQLTPNSQFIRNRIIFYAQPINPQQEPKDFADEESLGAKYLTLNEIIELKSQWRAPQLYQWANYVENGGKIYPLQLLSQQIV